MLELEERIIKKEGYNLHIVNSKKFKTIHVTAKFSAPLNREDVTKRALLPFVLQQGTETYPSSHAFRRALDDLYGSIFSIDGSKKGEAHVLTARLSLANPTYLSENNSILEKGLLFFQEALFKPKKVNGSFDKKIVDKEKQTLRQKIEALTDDKMQYANTRLIDEMCQDEPYQLHVYGYPEDLPALTADQLFHYYQQVTQTDNCDLYILGDLEEIDVERLIGNKFDRKGSDQAPPIEISDEMKVVEPKEVIEEQKLQQGKLHFGYRTYTTYASDSYAALQVFNAIFGGFPSSKLFINVREKNSLAYYAASRFESHKGLLFVFSGIAPNDFDKAKAIIFEQMQAMKDGDFSAEQIEEAKRLITNQYKEALDDPFGIIEVLYNQYFAQSKRSIQAFIEEISAVAHDDIVAVANKIELDTTYFLTAKGVDR
ncbi:Predicted Zn-dependent peptidase [Amphibacillus marinus]|uniref:Predicted Zn-dependent peptidase n=1 Tax=Amphibacillus marinus TaxID=872970 RepID=A0A1H8NPE1_9BACI|nr:pitrilysin family protein [Amphibacillus marinus]SEO31470.1 Predicted Zn-dependent peptidase [Amphibacillus marinus]